MAAEGRRQGPRALRPVAMSRIGIGTDLMIHSVTELNSLKGKNLLTRLLIDELNNSFFPEPVGERIAVVDDIFWTSYLIQAGRGR